MTSDSIFTVQNFVISLELIFFKGQLLIHFVGILWEHALKLPINI